MELFLKRLIIVNLFLVLNSAISVAAEKEFLIQSQTFVSHDYNATSDKTYGFFGLSYDNIHPFQPSRQNSFSKINKFQSSKIEDKIFNTEISGIFSPQAPVLNYINMTQMYLRFNQVSFGRKKEAWSALDETWNLGQIQPQFRWSPLNSSSQGLTGFFFDFYPEATAMPMKITVFGSFLFLPDEGANYQISNGKFESVNPWFPQMPEYVQFDNEGKVVNKINWDVQKPEILDVVVNKSYAANLNFGDDLSGLFLSASIGYFPSNQFLIAGKSYLSPSNISTVTVVPKFYYHTVTATDIKYSFKNVFLSVSYLMDSPEKIEKISDDLNYREYGKTQFYSPKLGLVFNHFEIDLSYLKVDYSGEKVIGIQADKLANLLPNKFEFLDSYKIQGSYQLNLNRNRSVRLNAEYSQSVENVYSLLTSGAQVQIQKDWIVDASLSFIQSGGAQEYASNFSAYDNNDSVSLGVRYAF